MPQITFDVSGMSGYFSLMLVAVAVIWGIHQAISVANRG